MKDFTTYTYERPDMADVASKINALVHDFEASTEVAAQLAILSEINEVRDFVETMMTLSSIRHSIDVNDPFYKEENDYFDEAGPVYVSLLQGFYKALVGAGTRSELERELGTHLFQLAQAQIEAFSDEIIEDLIEENKLSTEYMALIAKAQIPYEGEVYTLSQLAPFMESGDRGVRKETSALYYGYFEEHEEEFDDLFDKLVKVRDKMAKTLGYENFIPLGYKRMQRTDYGPREVKAYRDQIYNEVVPMATALYLRQQNRLGLSDFHYYDENLTFATGNAMPKGSPQDIVDAASGMYHSLSKETGEFFDFMLERKLMDLEAKTGKQSGGYCTFMANYQSPFIFSNFNGTQGDVIVLTHEAGHAFQMYLSRRQEVPEYRFPTYEACEIHSMSMEFLTWPWMDKFFGEDTEKFKFNHLSDSLTFLPYGASIDEFQHYVYENPRATPKERKRVFRQIERKYLPHRNYDDNSFLERGTYWYRQNHVFRSPFYYIDYTLAQAVAFQYYRMAQENGREAIENYIDFTRLGGTLPFTGLLKAGGLKNPFKSGTLAYALEPITDYLEAVNDKAL